MSSDRAATAFNLVSAVAAFAVQMAVSFLLSSYLVATVGEAATGFSRLANDFVSYASLVTVAFNSMGARFISASYHRGRVGEAAAYYSTLVVCDVALCLLFLPAAAAVLANIESVVDMGDADPGDVRLLFAFVFANFGTNMFVSLFGAALFVTNKLYIQNAVNLGKTVLNAALLTLLYGTLEPRVSYVSFVALFLTVVSVPVFLHFKRKLVPELKFSPSAFSWGRLGELASSGAWNSVNQCGHIMATGLDLLLANWFVGAGPMGVLSVAKMVPAAITSLAGTLNTNLEPELVVAYAREGTPGLLRLLRFDVRLSNLAVAVPVGVFCALAPAFYRLWMPSLDAAQLSVLSFLSLMQFIPWAGPQVLYNVFTVTNRLRVNSLSFVAGSALNVVVVLLFLRFTDLGVYAIAGTSSAISILRNLLVIAPYTARLLGLPWYALYGEVVVSIASCAASAVIALGVSTLVGAGGWPSLILSAVVACAVGWALLFVCAFSRDERSHLVAGVVEKVLGGR